MNLPSGDSLCQIWLMKDEERTTVLIESAKGESPAYACALAVYRYIKEDKGGTR